jgi:Arabinose efflux permease
VLGYGGLLLLGGRAADLLGRRRVFLVALAVFALVSVLGGLVSDPGLLIAARFVKGVAAAFTAPASMSLLTTTFPEGPMRNRAFSVYTVFGASGFSLGLVLSGLLTEISWRWTLLVPAPVAALVLLAAIRFIPRGERVARAGRRFDVPGALTITAAMLLLVYTVVSAQQAGWGSARTIGSFAAVAVLFGVFAAIERRSRDPLVPFGIFASRPAARQHRRGDPVRQPTLVPVPGHAVPADPGGLVGDRHGARVLAGRRDGGRPVHPDGRVARPVRPGAAHRGRLQLPAHRLRGVPAGRRAARTTRR